MKKRNRHIRPEVRRSVAAKLLTFVAVMLLTVALVDLRVYPVVEAMVSYQAKFFSLQTMNTAIQQEMADETVGYGDMVRLTRDNNGQVTAVETDIVAVNKLKARVAASVAASLEERGNQTLKIPVGTLLGSQLTSGRGPLVEVQLIPMGYVQSEMYNEFTDSGINQTLHKVMLKTSVQMVAVLPGHNVETEAVSSVCIAQTIIVGNVPEGYTLIDGDGESNISRVNDYGAQTMD